MYKKLLFGAVLGFLAVVPVQSVPIKLVIMQKDSKKVYLYPDIHGLGTQQQKRKLFGALVGRLQKLTNPSDYTVLVESLKSKSVPSSLRYLSLEALMHQFFCYDFDFLNIFSLYEQLCPCQMYDIDPAVNYAWDDLNQAFAAMQNAYDLFKNIYCQEGIKLSLTKFKTILKSSGVIVDNFDNDDQVFIFNKEIDGYITQIAKKQIENPHKPIPLSLNKILGNSLAARVLVLTYRELCRRVANDLRVFENKDINEIFSGLPEGIKDDLEVFKQQIMDFGFNENDAENMPLIELFVHCCEKEFLHNDKPKTDKFFTLITSIQALRRPLLNFMMEVNALKYILSLRASNVVVFAGAYHLNVLEGYLNKIGFEKTFVTYASKKGGTLCKSDQDIYDALDANSLLPLPSVCFDCIVSPE